MALEGGQGGEARGGRSQDAEDLPGRDGMADREASATPGDRAPATSLDQSGITPGPVLSEAQGLAQRKGSRARSFTYDNGIFEGEYLTYAILTQPSQGWVTNNGDGTFSFDPGLDFRDLKPGETRRISFSYQVSDGWSGAETASASLTVTGAADGALAIEMTSGSRPKRAEPREFAAPLDGPPEPGPPLESLEPKATEPAQAHWDATDPGAAVSHGEPPSLAEGEAEIAHHGADGLEASADSPGIGDAGVLLPDEPGIPVPDSGSAGSDVPEPAGEEPGGVDPDPAIAQWESETAQTVGEFEAAPETGDEDLFAGDIDPFTGEPAASSGGEDWAEEDSHGEFEDGSAAWPAAATEVLEASGDRHAVEDAPELQSEADPATPESEPGEDDQRYTILAQPPEGQVSATDRGEFQFTPGPGFPKLEVGELHQVSFTCEAVNGDGSTGIVIASLTITGTSEDPEICDVSFRRAQESGAGHGRAAVAGEALSDAVPIVAEDDPGAGHWSDSAAASRAAGSDSDDGRPAWQDGPKPDDGEALTTTVPGDEPRAWPEDWEATAAPAAEVPAQSPQRPERESEAESSDLHVDPAAEAHGVASGGGQDGASGGPTGIQPGDGAARDAAHALAPDSPGLATWPTDDEGAAEAFAEPPAADAEATAGDALAPRSDERPAAHAAEDESLAASAPEPAQQVEPAPEEPAAGLPSEDGASLLPGHQPAGPETASDLGSDPEHAAEPFARDIQSTDDDEAPAVSSPYGEQRAETATAANHDDEAVGDDYRGAVAVEAVATPLPDYAEQAEQEQSNAVPDGLAADVALEAAEAAETAAEGIEPDARVTGLDDIESIVEAGETLPETAAVSQDGGDPPGDGDRDTLQDDQSAPAEPAAQDQPATGMEGAADDSAAYQSSDVAGEDPLAPAAAAVEPADELGLSLVAADEEEDGPAELSDFTLSQHTVAEKCEAGTMVGQVLVAGAQDGSRFIFDLQNDAGGRFDINPRTGKITVADGALLDHAAADSHDILVQVIAHSGVSCRKTLTIEVLPAGSAEIAAPVAEPPQEPSRVADMPMPEAQGEEAGSGPAIPPEFEREAFRPDDGQNGRLGEGLDGSNLVDTLHLDGVFGGPGSGGWSIELTEGEIVETNIDNVKLSKDSVGNVALDGCPVKVAFQGVERIEW